MNALTHTQDAMGALLEVRSRVLYADGDELQHGTVRGIVGLQVEIEPSLGGGPVTRRGVDCLMLGPMGVRGMEQVA